MRKLKNNSRAISFLAAATAGLILSGCQSQPTGIDWSGMLADNHTVVSSWTSQSSLVKDGVTALPFYYDGETIIVEPESFKVWQDENFFYQSEGTYESVAVFGIDNRDGTWALIDGGSHKTHLMPLLVDELNALSTQQMDGKPDQWLVFLLESEQSGRTILAVVNPEDHKIQGFLSI